MAWLSLSLSLVLALIALGISVWSARTVQSRVADFDTVRSLDGRLANVEATLADLIERYTRREQVERMANARGKLRDLREQRDAAVEEALAVVAAQGAQATVAAPAQETREQVLARLRREVTARRGAH